MTYHLLVWFEQNHLLTELVINYSATTKVPVLLLHCECEGENNCVWTAFSWCSVLNFRDTHEVRSVVVCIRWKVPLVLHVLLWTTQTTQWLFGSQVNGFYTNRWVTNRTLWQFIIWWHRQFTQWHFTDDDNSYTMTVYQWYWYTVVINWYFYLYPSLWQTRSNWSSLHTIYIYISINFQCRNCHCVSWCCTIKISGNLQFMRWV